MFSRVCGFATYIILFYVANKLMQKNRNAAKMKIKPLFDPPTI